MRLVIVGLCGLGILLSGCASVVKGSTQSIAITTPPTTGADCDLTSVRGTWHVVSPGSVDVKRSKEDVQVHCTKAGFQDGVATIPSDFEGWTLGNLLLGGVVGFGVDAATGALNEYPHAFQVPMSPISAQEMPQPGGTSAPEKASKPSS